MAGPAALLCGLVPAPVDVSLATAAEADVSLVVAALGFAAGLPEHPANVAAVSAMVRR